MRPHCLKCVFKEEHPWHDDGSKNKPDLAKFIKEAHGPVQEEGRREWEEKRRRES